MEDHIEVTVTLTASEYHALNDVAHKANRNTTALARQFIRDGVERMRGAAVTEATNDE